LIKTGRTEGASINGSARSGMKSPMATLYERMSRF
jgi:hypothetical protein